MDVSFAVPQLAIQETFIIAGLGNIVFQDLSQSLIFIPIGIPELDEDEALQASLQASFADPEDLLSVEQDLTQSAPALSIFGEGDDNGAISTDLVVEILGDGILAATQLSFQTVDILGSDNTVFQESDQFFADLLLFEGEEESGDLEDFLARAAQDLFLDSLQFAIQDVIIDGNDNFIEQSLDQTIAAFVFLDDDIAAEASLTQFAVQEVFIGDGTTVVADNTIIQDTVQSIEVDFTFSDAPNLPIPITTDGDLDLSNFDIDTFIGEIFGNDTQTAGNQASIQDTLVTGDANLVVQSEAQTSIETVATELVTGGGGDDALLADTSDEFDGAGDLVFAGAGQDLVDLSNSALAAAMAPSATTALGGSDDDELIAGGGDRLFGGSGNDTLQATDSSGGNRLFGGAGDDLFLLGAGDRAHGGAGSDRFVAGSGGDNVLVGGAGADEFRIANDVLPAAANRIADFDPDEDRIEIGGLGASFDELTLTGETIAFEGVVLAIVSGVDTASLDAGVFSF